MSYDPHFLRGPDAPVLTFDQVAAFFAGRPGYSVEGNQFWYHNEETGVYFSFQFFDDSEELEPEEWEAPEDDLVETPLSFNLNYFRPHTFGLEAEPELRALTSGLELLVDDPQNQGMGRGAYSSEGFLHGWNAGNRFGYRALTRNLERGAKPISPGTINVLPSTEIERLWRWNYLRPKIEQQLGVDAYVSIIRLVRWEGDIKSFAIWGDAIPQAIPEVDLLVLVRDEIAKASLFKKKTRQICVAPYTDLAPLSDLAEARQSPVPYLLFPNEPPPRRLVEFFRSATPVQGQLDGLSWDEVLNAELLAEALADQG